MRDQPAAAVDREGLALLPDLDLGHHLPDELEIDLGDADARVASRAGHGERHVGLGLAAEIDRAVIDLLGDGFGELRILGKVGATPTASMASPETRGCSWRRASSCGSSVIAGPGRSSRSASKRRCSSALAVHGSCVVQPIWPSMSLMYWLIFPAAAIACSRWMRVSASLFSWYENQISNRPLVRSATDTTLTNSATYFRNSRLPKWVPTPAAIRRSSPAFCRLPALMTS